MSTTLDIAAPSPTLYVRRRPEQSLLYQLVRDNLASFIASMTSDDSHLPRHVEEEFRSYLTCGILAHGFLLRRCTTCAFAHPVAFSCRKRGFCPSCMAKRSAVVAAHLVDHVLPHQAYRQWVVTLPLHLRYLVANNRELQTKVHTLIIRSISEGYTAQASSSRGKTRQTGFVSFTQYASTHLALNPHFHIIYLDGCYEKTSTGRLHFRKSPAPSPERVAGVLATISQRLIALLIKRGILAAEGEWLPLPDDDPQGAGSPLFAALQRAVSLGYATLGPLEFGPVRKLGKSYGWQGEPSMFKSPYCAKQNGITLHCARRIKATRRRELEELIRYVTRPPLGEQRLKMREDGLVEFTLKRTFSDGTRVLVLSPLALLARLAAIIPPVWHNLTRFGGILAARAHDRAAVVPTPTVAHENQETSKRYSWAVLLKRIFQIDLLRCPRCGSQVRTIAAITEPGAIASLLRHFGLSTDPPGAAGNPPAPPDTTELSYHPC